MTTTATPVDARPEDPDADGEHDRAGHEPAHGGEDDLLHGDRAHRERRQQPVLDLVGVGELDHQGQRRALQPGQDGGQGHQPREEHLLVVGLGVAELGEDLAEHEEEEQGLEDHLGQEDGELAPGDEEVAPQDGQTGAPRAPARERGLR
jgi:hypothetical protein